MPSTRLEDGPLMPTIPDGYHSDGDLSREGVSRRSCQDCCSSLWGLCRRRSRRVESGYEVIIRNGYTVFGTNTVALSDPRLKPRHPICLILLLVIFCVGAVIGVFLLVPRGVVVNSPKIKNDIMTRTMYTYTLVADVDIPISNDNYLPAQVSGNVSMFYYGELAGSSVLQSTHIRARSTDQVQVLVNASFVPMDYVSAVVQHCSYFPNKLVFFLRGELKLETRFRTRHVGLDTYSIISCPKFTQ